MLSEVRCLDVVCTKEAALLLSQRAREIISGLRRMGENEAKTGGWIKKEKRTVNLLRK